MPCLWAIDSCSDYLTCPGPQYYSALSTPVRSRCQEYLEQMYHAITVGAFRLTIFHSKD